jgi:hypothetical protein
MRKIKWFAAAVSAALTLAGVALWVSSTTQARVPKATGLPIFEMQSHAGKLPVQRFDGFSFVFEPE